MNTKPTTPPPPPLDAEALKNIADAQAAMKELIARLPRRFGYADELGMTFRAGHDR